MKAPKRKVGVLIVIILIVIQFVQPTRNISEGFGDDDIAKAYNIPQELHSTFVTKCYDCHSNNTEYPWYFSIQPIGWWLAAHVHDGKEHLNFSEFGKYDAKKLAHQLEELEEVTEDGSMPLKAYVLFQKEKKLTEKDKEMIFAWIKSMEGQSAGGD